MSKRIAIIGTGLMGWGGGIDFLIDFIRIFTLHPEEYECEVFLPNDGIIERILRKIVKKEDIKQKEERIIWCLRNECPDIPIIKYNKKLLTRHRKYEKIKELAKTRRIDFLMPMNALLNGIMDKRYITIGYIVDFQHKHLPHLFSEEEINKRDLYFEKIVNYYDFAFTQSKDTINDIRKYYGAIADSIYVMYDYPHEIVVENNQSADVLKKYNITNPYFMVCNQFWEHKDHKVVFDALEILYKRGYNKINIVCTGDTNDYRNPDYFSSLMKHVSEMHCSKNIMVLGFIDKRDQISLMKNSISLVQPTLFEGNPGGGSVVDAEACGVPCIVSDIPVNLEIPKCYDTKFFKAGNADDLAAVMESAIENYNPKIPYYGKSDYELFYREYDSVMKDMIKRKSCI